VIGRASKTREQEDEADILVATIGLEENLKRRKGKRTSGKMVVPSVVGCATDSKHTATIVASRSMASVGVLSQLLLLFRFLPRLNLTRRHLSLLFFV
jgi:hypothetical protein